MFLANNDTYIEVLQFFLYLIVIILLLINYYFKLLGLFYSGAILTLKQVKNVVKFENYKTHIVSFFHLLESISVSMLMFKVSKNSLFSIWNVLSCWINFNRLFFLFFPLAITRDQSDCLSREKNLTKKEHKRKEKKEHKRKEKKEHKRKEKKKEKI